MTVATVQWERPAWRIGRAENPLQVSRIEPTDATLEKAANRFDVPGGGVLYAASTVRGTYIETLARYRPTPKVLEAIGENDSGFMTTGGIPQDWRMQRRLVKVDCEEPLPFVDVDAPETLDFLSHELTSQLVGLGFKDLLDISDIRGRNRRLTRLVARWAYTATDELGQFCYSGIRYKSRVDDDCECWAIFEETKFHSLDELAIDLDDEELRAVAQLYGLTVF